MGVMIQNKKWAKNADLQDYTDPTKRFDTSYGQFFHAQARFAGCFNYEMGYAFQWLGHKYDFWVERFYQMTTHADVFIPGPLFHFIRQGECEGQMSAKTVRIFCDFFDDKDMEGMLESDIPQLGFDPLFGGQKDECRAAIWNEGYHRNLNSKPTREMVFKILELMRAARANGSGVEWH